MPIAPQLGGVPSRRPRDSVAGWVWLLTVDFGAGLRVRWVSRPCEIDGSQPAELTVVEAGLEGASVRERLEGRNQAIGVSVWPPTVGALANPAQWVTQGNRIAGSPAELALVPVAETSTGSLSAVLADRIVAVRGFVSTPSYGDGGEPLDLAIKPEEAEDLAVFPPETWRVTETTWPDAYDRHRGRVYPVPFGKPGTGIVGGYPASPALVVEASVTGSGNAVADTLLIAAGHVDATTVVVATYAEGQTGTINAGAVTVTKTTDPLGNPVSTVAVSGVAFTADADRPVGDWWVIWSSEALTELDGAQVNTVGGLATYLSRRSSVKVDGAAMAASAKAMAWAIDGYLDEQTSPIAYIRDRVVGTFPVTEVTGPDGWHLRRLWFGERAASEALATLTEGDGNTVRASSVRVTRDGRATEIRVRWRRDDDIDEFRRVTILRANRRGDVDEVIEVPSAGARIREQGRHVVEVELPDCHSAATAALVGRFMVWREATPWRTIDVEADTGLYGRLRPGDVVLYTDAGLGLDASVCHVLEVERSDGPWLGLQLRLP